MIEQMRKQVRERLKNEVGLHATEEEASQWSEEEMRAATLWMDALRRRKEGGAHEGDAYTFPPLARRISDREAQEVDASTHLA